VRLQTRLLLAASAAVLLAIVGPALLLTAHLQHDLQASLDAGLRARADIIAAQASPQVDRDDDDDQDTGPDGGVGANPDAGTDRDLSQTDAYYQKVSTTGVAQAPPGQQVSWPTTPRAAQVAQGSSAPYFETIAVGGVNLRVYTRPGTDAGTALQVARPLTEVESIVASFRKLLLGVLVAGVGLAAAFGWLVARAALAPVRKLTHAAEQVAATRDLSVRIAVTGGDELGSLAASINTMLEALERAVDSQQQLVADASHELRTPLTSLRTNVEVLAEAERLDPLDRQRLVDDLVTQLDDLAGLVSDLVELARGDAGAGAADAADVRLDQLVEAAVVRAARHYPAVTYTTDLERTVVRAVPAALDRAVTNLLDNAGKWSPDGGTVAVRLADAELVVTDEGPGIPAEDLPHVFDRFYRSTTARARPGSGLGLAIVRQVADACGATITARSPESGGTVMSLTFA